jgi:glycolate oxidase FAD binding subunit
MPSSSDHAMGSLKIDDVAVADYVVPGDARALADVLASASALGQKIAPIGGGTALGLGNPPEQIDIALSTERLSGIIDYEPTDLVLSVGAGARFGDVQAVLGEHGQRLPLDPPGGSETTIGGLIATALFGPLRHSAGTLRDLLIGIEVAHPSGTVTKAGGMVVKNVSGYDMPRLYYGSLGTLGVVTSANFKVLPRPRMEMTLVFPVDNPADAFTAVSRLRSSGIPLAALEAAFRDGSWLVAVRIEGREQSVDQIAERAQTTVAADTAMFTGSVSTDWWTAYVGDQTSANDMEPVVIRCGTRPRDVGTLAEKILAAMEDLGVGVPFLAATPSVGVVTARLDFGAEGSADRLAAVQSALIGLATTVTILAAPAPWKLGLDVWGQIPEGFEVMQALREQFDPSRTVNPGRFAGFL